MASDMPYWQEGAIFTLAVFIAFTLVFGVLFLGFSLNGDETSNLRVLHAPLYAALPTAFFGIVYLVGIIIRLFKPNIGKPSS